MIRAVIFDMDGVLIDSEIVYHSHQYKKLQPRYPWLTPEHLYPLVGMDSREEKQFIGNLLGRDLSDPAFIRELQGMFEDFTVDYSTIMRKEVPQVLSFLRQNHIRIVLASSNSVDNIETVLHQCGIRSFFECIISGEQFTRSKPDPAIYLYALEQLRLLPDDCLIVEDSGYGIAAAKRAGVRTAALTDSRFNFDQSAADDHLSSLGELEGLISRLNCMAGI